ncbi:MAG: TonB-dependent receptor, partial [Desulfobulbaceae bacterium]|nr:TonB-dependent receptor [Desulfobulbaceae bacterium]
PSYNEFNPLFLRNRFALQANGVVGGNSTLGDEIVLSGVWGRGSYSLGQFHYETDGLRENNDQEQDIYNVFAQVSLSHKTSLQAEYRYENTEKGDVILKFDMDEYNPNLRQEEKEHSMRLGFHHAFAPHSDFIASAIYSNLDSDAEGFYGCDIAVDSESYMAEIQHLFRSERFHMTSGIGYFDASEDEIITDYIFPSSSPNKNKYDTDHTNFYVYSLINYPETVTWTLGASVDLFKDNLVDHDQFNPKLGFTWKPFPSTSVRAALFRVLKRTLISNQTIEPTQVAGFNQFFDDFDAAESSCYGIAIDQKFSPLVYAGVEFFNRELEVPFLDLGPYGSLDVRRDNWEEKHWRTYLCWTPQAWLAFSGEYKYERTETEFYSPLGMKSLRTHQVTPGISVFHRSGASASLQATYVYQEGEFGDPYSGFVPEKDSFWVVDASIGYRLPKRWGLVTLQAKNIFDETFKFLDMDDAHPRIAREQLIVVKVTLSF